MELYDTTKIMSGLSNSLLVFGKHVPCGHDPRRGSATAINYPAQTATIIIETPYQTVFSRCSNLTAHRVKWLVVLVGIPHHFLFSGLVDYMATQVSYRSWCLRWEFKRIGVRLPNRFCNTQALGRKEVFCAKSTFSWRLSKTILVSMKKGSDCLKIEWSFHVRTLWHALLAEWPSVC